MNAQNKWNQITRRFFLAGALASILILPGCGGGGSSAPPVVPAPSLSVAARGYYTGTGNNTSPMRTPNYQAMADSDKLVIVDQTSLVFYNVTFIDVTATTFTASVRIYKDGDFVRTTTINDGAIVESNSLTGTFTGTGDYANGDFDLTYNAINTRPKVDLLANKTWLDSGPVTGTINTNSDLSFKMTINNNFIGSLAGCVADNFKATDVESAEVGRLRRFTSSPLGTCSSPGAGKQLTGFITTYDSSAANMDDVMLLMTFDNDLVYTGILPCGTTPCI